MLSQNARMYVICFSLDRDNDQPELRGPAGLSAEQEKYSLHL